VESLKDELLAMQAADLQLRERLVAQGRLSPGYNEEMAALHRRHAIRLGKLIDTNGWPGRSLVGDEGCAAAWLVLQHSLPDPALMRRALPLLEAAVRAGEAPPAQLAYLTDRIRTLQGQLQIYGTQHDWDDSGQMSPLPTEDVADLEARRSALGMESQAAHTARLREQVARERESAPADLAAYRREADDWARSLGWRE
jgi:hypothetical protein